MIAPDSELNLTHHLHFVPLDGVAYDPVLVSDDYMTSRRPEVGGYYVLYADGRQSFIPMKSFKDSFSRDLGLPFLQAIPYVPLWTPDRKFFFAEREHLSPELVNLKNGSSVQTMPLRFGSRFNFMAIATATQPIIEEDKFSDYQTVVFLKHLYLKVSDSGRPTVIRIPLRRRSVPTGAGAERKTLLMNLVTTDLIIDEKSLGVRSQAGNFINISSPALPSLKNTGYSIEFMAHLSGEYVPATGQLQVDIVQFGLHALRHVGGGAIPESDNEDLNEQFTPPNAELVGYDVEVIRVLAAH